ncbi:MAG: hypothetical protein FWF18_01690 [Dehalococcoidia bacterium]|nr:hypothetical protein [Dehalococcoidia bacterium]
MKRFLVLATVLSLLAAVSSLGSCVVIPQTIYGVGDTYESYDSSITLNSASRMDSITIDGNTIQAEDGKNFLVLNVTITAKRTIALENQRFIIAVLNVVADADLSKGLNNGVDYLSNYVLINGDALTFNVVFSLHTIEGSSYSVHLHEASFDLMPHDITA